MKRNDLKNKFDELARAGRNTECLNSQFEDLFHEYASLGIAHFDVCSGYVEGIGSGKINNVFALTSTPSVGARRGTPAKPGIFFRGKVAAFGVLVLVESNHGRDKQKWHSGDGYLIRPVCILSTLTEGGNTTLHAVFGNEFETGKHQYGFRIMFQDQRDASEMFAVELVAGSQRRGRDQPHMLVGQNDLFSYQRENADQKQSGWMFTNTAKTVAAGIGAASSTCSLTVQLQGSRDCSKSDARSFGQNLEETYEGFGELDQDCQKFLFEYFNTKPKPAKNRGTRGRSGATFTNLHAAQATSRRETSVAVYDSAEPVTATLCMTVGEVWATHFTQKATQEQIALPVDITPMNSVMKMLHAPYTPELLYIQQNTITMDGNVLVVLVRHHDGKDDLVGWPIPPENVQRNDTGRQLGYKVELDLLVRVTFIVVQKVTTEPIVLTASYLNTDTGILEPENPVELDDKPKELEFPLQYEESDPMITPDGWNAVFTIDGVNHTIKLRFFTQESIYVLEDDVEPEAVEPVFAQEHVQAVDKDEAEDVDEDEAEDAQPPLAPDNVEASGEPALEPLTEIMASLKFKDPKLAIADVIEFGITNEIFDQAQEEDINAMFEFVTNKKRPGHVQWTPLQQRWFLREFEARQKKPKLG
jgi:hypothetical protein